MKTPTKQDLIRRIKALEHVIKRRRGRPSKPVAERLPTGKFTLEITTVGGAPVRQIKGLTPREFTVWRRDLYKIIVLGLKQKVSMHKIIEYKKAE